MNKWLPAVALAGLLTAPIANAQADPTWDTVELVNGRTLRGSASWNADGTLRLRLPLGEMTVKAHEVLAVRFRQDPLQEVEQRERDGHMTGTLEERLAFARLCDRHGFVHRARQAWLAVLRLDADHDEARLALGYVRHDGRWMTPRARNLALGLVEFRGQWLKPSAVQRILDDERRASLALQKLRLERRLLEAKLRAERAKARAARAAIETARAQAAAEARARADAEARARAAELTIVEVAPCPLPVRRARPYRRAYRPRARWPRRPRARAYRPITPRTPSNVRVLRPVRRARPTPRPRPVRRARPAPRPQRYLLRHQASTQRTPVTINRGPGVR